MRAGVAAGQGGDEPAEHAVRTWRDEHFAFLELLAAEAGAGADADADASAGLGPDSGAAEGDWHENAGQLRAPAPPRSVASPEVSRRAVAARALATSQPTSHSSPPPRRLHNGARDAASPLPQRLSSGGGGGSESAAQVGGACRRCAAAARPARQDVETGREQGRAVEWALGLVRLAGRVACLRVAPARSARGRVSWLHTLPHPRRRPPRPRRCRRSPSSPGQTVRAWRARVRVCV